METRLISQLRPHPKNGDIYGDRLGDNFQELLASVKEKGVYTPLLITFDDRVISGHRRLRAAAQAGLVDVGIIVFDSEDEDEILEALIHSNRGMRNRTNEMVAKEAKELWEVEQRRASERMSEGGKGVEQVPHLQTGKTRDKVGSAIGISGKTAERAVKVLDAIEGLSASGKAREAEQLRTALNKSVSGAFNKAKEAGHITVQSRAPQAVAKELAAAPSGFITLADWRAMDYAAQQAALATESSRTKFNWQSDDNIEWALWSWNPVTGCKHNCPYCYARDIAERFYEQKFEPAFLPERLSAPFNTPMKPEAQLNIGYKNVFTCSMADLFGRWVPREWIEAVLDVIAQAPQWNFLMLTKFPIRLAEFDFPDNAWVGTTVDCQARVKNAEQAFSRVNAKVKWLSCEPLLEPLQFTDLSMFQWIVLGGSSKSTQTPEWRPPRQWINDIEDKAHQAGCMVYEKTNLLDRVREYPGQGVTDSPQLPGALRYLAEVES